MKNVAPTRDLMFGLDLQSIRVEQLLPLRRTPKGAWPDAAAPLHIMGPTRETIAPVFGNVFVNDDKAAGSHNPAHLAQHLVDVLNVMQDVRQQHPVERVVSYRDPRAVSSNI